MDGVVSLLDADHYRRVEELWSELAHEFGLRGVFAARLPHFSYHVAQDYDTAALHTILQQFNVGRVPFRIHTAGLAIFTGQRPVLYIPIVRTLELSQFQESLWHAVAPAAVAIHRHYSPNNWMPHITLAYGDLSHAIVPEVFRLLSNRDFAWDIAVDNLALICETSRGLEERDHFTLGAG
jgi:2'-5' RNA ligase